jgi:hypothetical protein
VNARRYATGVVRTREIDGVHGPASAVGFQKTSRLT